MSIHLNLPLLLAIGCALGGVLVGLASVGCIIEGQEFRNPWQMVVGILAFCFGLALVAIALVAA